MANVKITQLTETVAPTEADILPIVTDIATTPVTKKTTFKTLFNKRHLYSITPAGNFSLTAGTSVQSVFASDSDAFTLEGAKTYLFEGLYMITKSGSTATTAMAFALGGGASVTSIHYTALAQNVVANTTGATHGSVWSDRVAATVINATSAGDVYISFKGIIRMNVGGTVTPQIQFSASPTSPVMVADSYIRFTEIGTNVENTQGNVG
jgi:hypothetical protein